MSFYGKVYPKTWQIIKNNYYLLFFGLFASVLGFFSEANVFLNLNDTQPDFISSNILQWGRVMETILSSGASLGTFSGMLSMLSIFVIMAIVIVITVSSQGALIHSAYHNNLKKSKKAESKGQTFKENFQVGLEKFWPLLGLHIVHSFITFFFLVLIIDPLIYFLTTINFGPIIYLLIAIITFFILIPLVIIISFVTRYGSAYIVIKNQKLVDAFFNGWLLFKVNWLVTIENAIFLMLVTIAYSFLLSSALALIFVPIVIVSILVSATNPVFFFIVSSLGAFLAVVMLFAGIALFGAFYNVVWANVFMELSAPGKTQSKLHRVTKKHLPHLAK
ncbi:hypothetical protein C0580_01035 [Candidatus Parcubacteria bacterium]|nr:MAG: hypothetical protein C0580_01035 [Candidatus Parcubacteria bacterium]